MFSKLLPSGHRTRPFPDFIGGVGLERPFNASTLGQYDGDGFLHFFDQMWATGPLDFASRHGRSLCCEIAARPQEPHNAMR